VNKLFIKNPFQHQNEQKSTELTKITVGTDGHSGSERIRLCSSSIVVGIFGVGFVGSLVVGVGCFDFYVLGMAFYSIEGVYVL
jgi:hypothetical protein